MVKCILPPQIRIYSIYGISGILALFSSLYLAYHRSRNTRYKKYNGSSGGGIPAAEMNWMKLPMYQPVSGDDVMSIRRDQLSDTSSVGSTVREQDEEHVLCGDSGVRERGFIWLSFLLFGEVVGYMGVLYVVLLMWDWL